MGIVAGTLTPEEIQQAIQQVQRLAASASKTIQSNQFVFFAAFDGTNNDRDHLELAGDPQMTNAAQLEIQVREANTGNPDTFFRYYPGPGTDGTLPGSSALPWQVTQQVTNTALQAYNDFALEAARWLRNNPDGSVTVAMTSFSRGGASAAIFPSCSMRGGLSTQKPEPSSSNPARWASLEP